MKHPFLIAAAATALLGTVQLLHAEDGIRDDRILVGQSAAFDGPAQALGLGMRLGLNAAFKEVNDKGGVHGRQIEMIAYDDGYEPERAIKNTEKLIDSDKVFALIGAVGTPTSKVTYQIAKADGVPFVGPFTGAGFLRDPSNPHVINMRGTYDQETESWIAHLTDDLDSKRIAILYQDDSFGLAGLSGVNKALDKRGMKLVAEGSYQRNTVAVKSALLKIRKAKPDAVVMVGSYKPIAAFVKSARKIKMKSTFVTISFVGSKALAQELGPKGAGIVVTQVVPFYEDTSLPLVKNYQNALAAANPNADAGFVSLEGYMVGRLFIQAMLDLGPNASRQQLIEHFQSQYEIDLGGTTLSYGPGDNQGMDRVYLSVLQADGTFKYVDRLDKAITTAELP